MDAYGRRSIRLRGYDYALPRAYFITISTYQRKALFGEVIRGRMNLNFLGEIASACWRAIPVHFADVTLDASVAMPDHLHGIIFIRRGRSIRKRSSGSRNPPWPAIVSGETPGSGSLQALLPNASPLHTRPRGTSPQSLAAIIQNYKSLLARRINRWRRTPRSPVWQRNFYEHVVRDDEDLARIRDYILQNPAAYEDS